MKYNLLILFLILSNSYYSHPIKMSSCSISISKKRGKMNIQFKVFMDDFKDCIERNTTEKINYNRLTLKHSDIIDQYINNSFQVIINNLTTKIYNPTIQINHNENTICLNYTDLDVEIGRKNNIVIKNSLLMDCNSTQTNNCTIHLIDKNKSFNYQFIVNKPKITFKT